MEKIRPKIYVVNTQYIINSLLEKIVSKHRLRFVIFMATMLSMTLALVLAVDINDDPREYGVNPTDIFRGSMEALTLLLVFSFTLTEVSNIVV